VSPRTGRPLKGETKKEIRLQLRLNSEENALIEECAERMNTTRIDVVMQGIKMVKAKLDEKQK